MAEISPPSEGMRNFGEGGDFFIGLFQLYHFFDENLSRSDFDQLNLFQS